MNYNIVMLAIAGLVLLAPAAAAASPGEAVGNFFTDIALEAQLAVGGVFVAVMAFGGYKLMGAADDPQKKKAGWAIIGAGFVGALVIFLGPVLADYLSDKGSDIASGS